MHGVLPRFPFLAQPAHGFPQAHRQRGNRFEALSSALHFTKHAQDLLQQAGMTWPATKLLGLMAVLTIPGFILGIMFLQRVVVSSLYELALRITADGPHWLHVV